MGSNREKANIANAILEIFTFLKGKKNISHFDGSNNIFVDCISIFHSLLSKIIHQVRLRFFCQFFYCQVYILRFSDIWKGRCLRFISSLWRFYEELKEKSFLSLYLFPFTLSQSMPLPFTLSLYIYSSPFSLSPLSLSLSLYLIQ